MRLEWRIDGLNVRLDAAANRDAPEQLIRPERGLLDFHSNAWMLFQILPRSGQFGRSAAKVVWLFAIL